MTKPTVDLRDEDLFGNEAAEDERAEVFDAYAYERPELNAFCDPNRPLQVVRAYKGEGKSALMRVTRTRVAGSNAGALVIDTTGLELAPNLDALDFDASVRAWKQAIFNRAASEIGARIGTAWSDDKISLVELAERNGFKSRNFVSAILDRLKSSKVPIERQRQPPSDPGLVLQRQLDDSSDVWLFIDDVDRNFEATKRDELKVTALFDACRTVVRQVPSLRLRLAIRPNTWSLLKHQYEGLSHVEQYTTTLTWTEQQMLDLLERIS